ncbi:MAG: alpha/beta fold hydrolase [Candidatus Binatus sp.]|uniref:esterase/lipase family protein n=1 Tax=Candidatus Binatus sp. TaxID=2811406 RepID=UPI003C76379D
MTPTTQSSIPQELGINELIAARPRGWRRRITGCTEYAVAVAELAGLVASPVFWGAKVRRGDGRSVLVIPGYGAGDIHFAVMRNWIERMGYRAVKSGLDFNSGWSEEIVEEIGREAEDEFRGIGHRVTLIGHSLGGLQARSIAQRRPNAVRRLIMLGAPLSFAGGTIPPSVAITSIYVAADLPYEPRARESHAENIEVRGSHGGLAVNRRVYALLAELLCRHISAT